MRIGFTGTQKGMSLSQKKKFKTILEQLLSDNFFDVQFHHGDCVGADNEAHNIVDQYLSADRIYIHPPTNDKKRAWCFSYHLLPVKSYLERNHDIVDTCDVLIATPKEQDEVLRSGTWATIRYAQKQNKKVIIINRLKEEGD